MNDFSPRLAPYVLNILDSLDDGVYVSDQEGVTLHVNPMYERLTGLKTEDLLGRNVRDLVDSGLFDVVVNPEVVVKKKPVTHVQSLKDGKRVVLRGFPVFDDGGEVALVITIVRDVTLIGQMRDQISQQKKLISIYHDQIEHLTHAGQSRNSTYDAPHLENITDLIKRVAVTDATVLLLGESGVGKDRFARMVHEHSPRNKEVFLKVDCGSISESLIESELFGYAPGAFTGAAAKGKPGHFEIADKGTVFLDEIGELPLPMQAKLLRVLQDKEVMAVGSSVPKKVDVRVIAATNRNLEEEVNKGTFRTDLYYRLRVAVVNIPPLREIPGMIPGLVNHFLELYGTKYKKSLVCAGNTMNLFLAYQWPGNIRELENTIQSLVVTSIGHEIIPEDLPPSIFNAISSRAESRAAVPVDGAGKTLKQIMSELEQQVIRQTVEKHGTITKAAEVLGVNRTTLFRKMR